MVELLFSPVLPWGLMAGGVLTASLAARGHRWGGLWALLAGLSTVLGVLATLIQGGELEDTLPAVLLIVVAALLAPGRGKDGGAG